MQFLTHSYVVIEVDVTEALKSSIFVVQRAAAPKNGVELIGVTKHPNYLPLVGYLTVRIFTPSKTTFERMK